MEALSGAFPYTSALIVVFLSGLAYIIASYRGHPPFPPGPKGLPILGNIRDIPVQREWQTYSQWAKEYGAIVSVHILGQRLVFINTLDLSRELFETRSSLYMDRPFSPTLDMMGYATWLVGLLHPGQQWNMCRRLMAQSFNPQAVQKWHSYHLHEAHRLLARLLDDPENFFGHVDRAVIGSLMLVLYGHRIPTSGEDDLMGIHDKSVHDTSRALASGAYLFNIFPLLRHLPLWMFGASFKRQAKEAILTGQKVLHEPTEMIKQKMAKGIVPLSHVSSLLEGAQDEFAIKQTAATAYNAAIGGSTAIILSSILAMTLFPDAQVKAQQEIDNVIGGDRLPEFSDRASLPYTEAFVKELFRWATPAPIGLPRRLSQNDVVRGYFIPAGSIIMSNMWGILHDENRFPNPSEFIPERHLDKEGRCLDPTPEGFGFGKRVCPGRHLVDALAWIAIVSILATFEIRKEIGKDGNEISPQVEYTPGVVRCPKPFKSIIKLRSHALEDLIRGANERDAHIFV